MSARTATGVALRRQSRALARIHAHRLLSALQGDDDAAVLAALHGAAGGLSAAVGAYVAGVRDEGASWQTVGDHLGVSRQAAQQRFGASRAGDVAALPGEVAAVLEATGYDERVPAGKLRPGAVGHLAGYCYRRQHGRCPGHALGDPCACWCHEPGALIPTPADRGRLPEWSEL